MLLRWLPWSYILAGKSLLSSAIFYPPTHSILILASEEASFPGLPTPFHI